MLKYCILTVTSLCLALGKTKVQTDGPHRISRDLELLNDWLEENETSNRPEINLERAVAHFVKGAEKRRNEGILRILAITQYLGDARECDDNLLATIELLHKSAPAYEPKSILRVHSMIHPYAKRAAHICEPLHEQRYKAALQSGDKSQDGREKLKELSDTFNEKFLLQYRKRHPDSQLLVRQCSRNAARALSCCCLMDDYDLLHSIRRTNFAQLKQSLQRESLSIHEVEAQIAHLFEKLFTETCRFYNDLMYDVYAKAGYCLSFEGGKDQAFLQRRSEAFKIGLLRFKLCNDVLDNKERYIQRLSTFVLT